MKTAIDRAAQDAGTFQLLVCAVTDGDAGCFVLAELNDFLSGLGRDDLAAAVAPAPPGSLSPSRANYVAAMVEYACERAGIPPPAWTLTIPPLEHPEFGSSLESLRPHLLRASPPPFRRRNIFIDASLGDRV